MESRTTLDLPLPRLSRVAHHTLFFHTDASLFERTGVRIVFTERTGGVSSAPYATLNLASHVADDPQAVSINRHRVFAALGMADYQNALLSPNQVHGDEVFVFDHPGADISRLAQGCDAVVCLVDKTPVMLCFADCVPVVMVAPGGGFAIAHAGWRGALAGMAGKTLMTLCERTRVAPDAVNIYIGAHIRECCYETSAEILARFREAFGPQCDAGASHLNLTAAIRADLAAVHVDDSRVCEIETCTAQATDQYFSYRHESGICGRHAAIACRIGQEGDDDVYSSSTL